MISLRFLIMIYGYQNFYGQLLVRSLTGALRTVVYRIKSRFGLEKFNFPRFNQFITTGYASWLLILTGQDF